MEPFPVFRNFNKNGLEAVLSVSRVTDLEDSVKAWIFRLTKKNMQVK